MADDLPKKYLAAVFDEPGKISTKVVEKDMPEPAAGDVLIKLYVSYHSDKPYLEHEKLIILKAPIRGFATATWVSCCSHGLIYLSQPNRDRYGTSTLAWSKILSSESILTGWRP